MGIKQKPYFIGDDQRSRILDHIDAFKCKAVRRDAKGRAFYCVPTSSRRNGQQIIPQRTIQKLLKEDKITQLDIDSIRPV